MCTTLQTNFAQMPPPIVRNVCAITPSGVSDTTFEGTGCAVTAVWTRGEEGTPRPGGLQSNVLVSSKEGCVLDR